MVLFNFKTVVVLSTAISILRTGVERGVSYSYNQNNCNFYVVTTSSTSMVQGSQTVLLI